MAAPDRTAGSFAVPLCLWQRAAFLCPTPSPSGNVTSSSGEVGRRERDSLRLRIAQLNHEYWKSISRGINPLHIVRLMQSLLKQYCTSMDSSEGVESIAAPVKVLTSNYKKESGQWKSAISLESLLAIPGVKATEKDKSVERLPLEALPIVLDNSPSQGVLDHPMETVSHTHPTTTITPAIITTNKIQQTSTHSTQVTRSQQLPQHNTIQQTRQTMQSNGAVAQFKYSTQSLSGRGKIGGPREDEDDEEPTSSKWRGRKGYNGRRRRGHGGWDWGTRKKAKRQDDDEDEEDDEEIEDGQRKTTIPFITAKDQHVLNQQKKHGGRTRVADSSTISQPHSTSYGCSKKSLGTRRAPGSRFVPPVRREDNNTVMCSDTLRTNRIPYDNSNTSSSELEGDPRLKNIEPRMVELIMNEIMDHGAPVEWDDIAGLQFAKVTIKEIVVWPMLRPDIFTGLRGPPKGILLFGPPGTGKTLIGKCIASQVNATFFSISASSLTSKWIGEGEKMVRALFAVAGCHQPAVIFMDEIDSLLSQRSDSEHESSRRIKTEFLVQLDGATTSADDRILIIGATNRPQEIDEAARRRLVKRLYIPLPDGPARKQIVNNLLKEQLHTLTPDELEQLSITTEGYSGADMANLCREAAYGPVREAAETIEHITAEEMRPVNYKDFEAALYVIRPSVSEQDLDIYIQWNKQFGCGRR